MLDCSPFIVRALPVKYSILQAALTLHALVADFPAAVYFVGGADRLAGRLFDNRSGRLGLAAQLLLTFLAIPIIDKHLTICLLVYF